MFLVNEDSYFADKLFEFAIRRYVYENKNFKNINHIYGDTRRIMWILQENKWAISQGTLLIRDVLDIAYSSPDDIRNRLVSEHLKGPD